MPGVCLCHKEIDRFPSSSTAPKSEILGLELPPKLGCKKLSVLLGSLYEFFSNVRIFQQNFVEIMIVE